MVSWKINQVRYWTFQCRSLLEHTQFLHINLRSLEFSFCSINFKSYYSCCIQTHFWSLMAYNVRIRGHVGSMYVTSGGCGCRCAASSSAALVSAVSAALPTPLTQAPPRRMAPSPSAWTQSRVDALATLAAISTHPCTCKPISRLHTR